ncbi:MAG: hypothetical protein HGJ94_18280 [Desulfosarcina sp.]|nr:hypothetical protein [Desulfosarcina sp.]
MTTTILPYTHIDGIPTFKDSDLASFYDQMVDDGTADSVFSDGTILSGDDFVRAMKDHGTVLVVIHSDGKPAGIAWINRIDETQRRAWIHFALFSNGWGAGSVALGRKMAGYFLDIKRDGAPVFEYFIGICPSSNQLAINFMLRCGGGIVGEIPMGCWNHAQQRSFPGTMIYYGREVPTDENI